MTKTEIQAVLDAHGKWLRREEGGVRANLSGANLHGANLTDANLTRADLTRANLTRANLTRANLTDANLTRADLTRANLTRADLTRANLHGADLHGANLTRADLTRANLTRAVNAPLLASIGWSDHGECGRTLTVMLHDSTGAEPMYRCGCFWGDEAKLRKYIADEAEHLRESRTEALDIVSGLMARMIARRKAA